MPFCCSCTKRRGTRRTTWLAQCTLPYMEVTLLKSITWRQQQQQQAGGRQHKQHRQSLAGNVPTAA